MLFDNLEFIIVGSVIAFWLWSRRADIPGLSGSNATPEPATLDGVPDGFNEEISLWRQARKALADRKLDAVGYSAMKQWRAAIADDMMILPEPKGPDEA